MIGGLGEIVIVVVGRHLGDVGHGGVLVGVAHARHVHPRVYQIGISIPLVAVLRSLPSLFHSLRYLGAVFVGDDEIAAKAFVALTGVQQQLIGGLGEIVIVVVRRHLGDVGHGGGLVRVAHARQVHPRVYQIGIPILLVLPVFLLCLDAKGLCHLLSAQPFLQRVFAKCVGVALLHVELVIPHGYGCAVRVGEFGVRVHLVDGSRSGFPPQ